jgi:carbon storage regulator
MLILSRRIGESFLIGDDIEVVITGVTGGQVKFGVQAPKDVPVLRSELVSDEPDEVA